jgi:Family of unknown function (DUF5317)
VILFVLIALATASVPLCGGSLAELRQVRVRRIWLILVALGLQVLVISVFPHSLPDLLSRLLHVVSYALAGFWLWTNRQVPWLWLLGLGGLCNLVAIGANGGIMPASATALRAAGRLSALHPGQFTNSAYQPGAHLVFLGDIFSVPQGWPLANVFSVGDVMIVAGAFLFLHTACRTAPTRWLRRSETMV